jgi:hypothetical protein
MFRSNWRIVFAFIGLLTLAAAVWSQTAPANSQKVEAGSNQATGNKQDSAAKPIAARNLPNGEHAVKPDCGTPKECRAEQRSKDDLVAQQLAAKAAADQARSSWWQTGVGAAGVILLILTVLYTHRATKAAVDAVTTLVGVERARISMIHRGSVTTIDGVTGHFQLGLLNVGRTTGILKETCIEGSQTGLFADFNPANIKKHNANIPTEGPAAVHALDFPLASDEFRFLVGYYKFSTIFSKRVLTDYFCLEIGDAELPLPPEGADATAAPQKHYVPVIYRTDLDWPPDEE